LNPSGFHFTANRQVNGREQFFPAPAKLFGDVNRAPTCGGIRAAQSVFDINHPLPGVKKIMIAAVVINRDFPESARLGPPSAEVFLPSGLASANWVI
jgi:hypothetical protein